MAQIRKGGITETGTSMAGRRGWIKDRNGKRGGRREQGGQWEPGRKRSLLVVDVSEYWEAYEGDGAD